MSQGSRGGDCSSLRVSGNWKAGWLAVLWLSAQMLGWPFKVWFKKVWGEIVFLSDSVDTNVWLSLGFIHSSRCGGGLSPSLFRTESEKQRERDAAAERRAGEWLRCFFELFIHTQTEPEWLDSNYWPVQSPSLFPSLSLSLTHSLADTHTPKEPRHTHTHTPYAFHLGQFHVVYVKADGVWSLQSTPGLLYCGNELWSQ